MSPSGRLEGYDTLLRMISLLRSRGLKVCQGISFLYSKVVLFSCFGMKGGEIVGFLYQL